MKTLRPFWVVLLALACLSPARLYGATQPDGSANQRALDATGKPPAFLGASVESLLDGDHRPDVIQCEVEDNSCEITIQLTARNETVDLGMHGMSRDVSLSAVDVDRDNDRDLVIASPGQLFPVAVWLNDGAGHFTEADPRRYAVPDAPTTKDGSIHETGDSEAHVVATIQYSQSSVQNPLAAFQAPAWVESAALAASHPYFSQFLLLCLSPRGPPFSVIL